MFSKNIRILYLYIVSFLALMAIVASTVSLVEKITNYIYPIDYTYSDSYLKTYDEKGGYTTNSDSNIIAQRENTQRRTLRELFTSLAVIIVATPLYSYHWTLVQKERKNE